jgi:hypothetical protein
VKTAIKLLLVLTVVVLPLRLSSRIENPQQSALLLLQKYSPDSYSLALMTSEKQYTFNGKNVRGNSFGTFLKCESRYEFLLSVSLAVHESTHYFSEIYSLKEVMRRYGRIPTGDYFCYYTGGGAGILVKQTSVFMTREIKDLVPVELRSIYYKVYVDTDDPALVSQRSGVYGLIDEMNAYVRGSRVVLDMFPLYVQNNFGEGLVNYYEDLVPDLSAALYFRYFMLTYLVYAEKKSPEMFASVIGNRQFLRAVARVDKDLVALISDYFAQKKKILKQAERAAVVISETNGSVDLLFPDQSRRDTDLNMELYMRLLKIFASEDYRSVAKKVGVSLTLPQYVSFDL